MRYLRAFALLGLVPAALVVLSGEVPAWRAGGTAIGSGPGLPPLGDCPIALNQRPAILFIGDSNTSGARVGGPSKAWPELLAQRLGGKASIDNAASGGATIADAAAVMGGAGAPDLVVIMLGTNDAAPRGLLQTKQAIPVSRFREQLLATARSWREAGSQVLVLAPPPAGSRAIERRIRPYRVASREAAAAARVHFLDPLAGLAGMAGSEQVLQYDALHLSGAGQQALAATVAACITLDEEAATPVHSAMHPVYRTGAASALWPTTGYQPA